MANTQGIPDEALPGMFTPSSSPYRSSSNPNDTNARRTFGAATTNRNGSGTSNNRQNALQQRLDLPMGTQPAAQVIRRKKNSNNSSAATNPQERNKTEPEPDQPPPVLGAIVERKRRRRPRAATKSKDTTSTDTTRTAGLSTAASTAAAESQTASSSQTSRFNIGQGDQTGFPSLDAPLGTFIDNKKAANPNGHTVTSAQSTPTATTLTTSTTTSTNTNNATPMERLKQETSKEADGLLSQMSAAQIKESQAELAQTLSPDMIAFLKQRRQKQSKPNQQNNQQGQQQVEHKQQQVQEQSSTDNSTKDTTSTKMEQQDPPQFTTTMTTHKAVVPKSEQDLASYQALSSIQSVQDLDSAFEAETGEKALFYFESKELQQENNGNSNDVTSTATSKQDVDWNVASDLLRSSVPRQNLWAARTIRDRLAMDLQQWLERNNSFATTSAATTTDPQQEQQAPWPYPVTLPVSLRCLLDASVSQRSNNGYALHSYVLQSLYLLLRIKIVPDQDVDVGLLLNLVQKNANDENVDGTATTTSTTTCHAGYQQWYAQDAVPSTPIDQCYQDNTSSVKPISVNGQDNVAYASNSSAESAVQDGESFQRDPLWTLLSKMRIIPRLAQLVHQSKQEQLQQQKVPAETTSSSSMLLQLPPEGIKALCGILALIAQRSPGAASSIAQHDTLIPDLVAIALGGGGDNNNGDGHSEASNDPTANVLPLVLLLSVLARQSNVAAAALQGATEDLLARVLTMSTSTTEAAASTTTATVVMAQKWTLILWRTLLRYGYALDMLEMVLTITVSQHALGSGRWPCEAELFSCLSTFLRHKPDEMSVEWMLVSTVQSAMQILETVSKRINAISKENGSTEPRDVLTLASCLDFLRLAEESREVDGDGSPASAETVPSLSKDSLRIKATLSLLLGDGFVRHAFQTTIRGFMLDTRPPATLQEAELEAAMSFFVESYLSLLKTYKSRVWIEDHLSVVGLLSETLQLEAQTDHSDEDVPNVVVRPLELPRRTWRNRCHTAILTALLSQETDGSLLLLESLFALIGRFQIGDEAAAHKLLEYVPKAFVKLEIFQGVSELAGMLLRGLTESRESSAQLKHSRLINEYEGDPTGGTEVLSLRNFMAGPSVKSTSMTLPVGRYWLWKVLAGSTERLQGQSDTAIPYNFLRVLDAACRTITGLEAGMPKKQCTYAREVSAGGKLYYVMNLCLQEEQLLEHHETLDMADALLSQYIAQFSRFAAASFLMECSVHAAGIKDDIEPLTAEEQKVKDWLTGGTTKFMKDLANFMNDLCAGYIDYGAQYGDFFTRCVRVFLLPAFPSKFRCDVMKRLEGLLHLLTIEMEDDEALSKSVQIYLRLPEAASVLPVADVEWLDALAGLFPKGCSHRPDMKFMQSLATCSLAGNLVQSVGGSRPGHFDVARQRLEQCDEKFAMDCVKLSLLVTNSSSNDGTSPSGYVNSCIGLLNETMSVAVPELNQEGWAEVLETLRARAA